MAKNKKVDEDLNLAKKQMEKTIKILDQSTKPKNVKRDKGRSAMPPGKRISESGKVYWETRANRSDVPLKRL